jgi:hypothetical protein
MVVGQVILSPASWSYSPMAGDKIACPTVLLDQGQFASPAASGFPSTYAMILPNSLFLIQ